jgi:hypothetical protein
MRQIDHEKAESKESLQDSPKESFQDSLKKPQGIFSRFPQGGFLKESLQDSPKESLQDSPKEKENRNAQWRKVLELLLDHQWHTVVEIGRECRLYLPSVIARMSDLKKPGKGGWLVDRRKREGSKLYEFRLLPREEQRERENALGESLGDSLGDS